jgi:hypothetical protein
MNEKVKSTEHEKDTIQDQSVVVPANSLASQQLMVPLRYLPVTTTIQMQMELLISLKMRRAIFKALP